MLDIDQIPQKNTSAAPPKYPNTGCITVGPKPPTSSTYPLSINKKGRDLLGLSFDDNHPKDKIAVIRKYGNPDDGYKTVIGYTNLPSIPATDSDSSYKSAKVAGTGTFRSKTMYNILVEEFKLDPNILSSVGYEIFFTENEQVATGVFELNIHTRPKKVEEVLNDDEKVDASVEATNRADTTDMSHTAEEETGASGPHQEPSQDVYF